MKAVFLLLLAVLALAYVWGIALEIMDIKLQQWRRERLRQMRRGWLTRTLHSETYAKGVVAERAH